VSVMTEAVQIQMRLRRTWPLTRLMWLWQPCSEVAPILTERFVYWIANRIVIAEYRLGRRWHRVRVEL
jgi:hypothetical protein